MKTAAVLLHLCLLISHGIVDGYVPPEVRQKWIDSSYSMGKALKTIEKLAPERNEGDVDLYYAVRFIDRNSHLFYAKQEERDALWEMANGSWELLMGYEQPKVDDFFQPYPPFADYAMAFIIIDTDDNYFGKGIASNPDFAYVALGGPSKVNERTRQLYMDYNDFYINGQEVAGWDLSYFMRGYARNWDAIERNRPPLAFTLIGVTEKILVVRGSKTGGMAIFRRIEGDMREAAYGRPPWKERIVGFWSNIGGNKQKA